MNQKPSFFIIFFFEFELTFGLYAGRFNTLYISQEILKKKKKKKKKNKKNRKGIKRKII